MNTIYYKGYYSQIEYSAEDNCLYGKIEGINDLVTFDSQNACEIEQSFHEAVDDYLQFCKEVGKKPDKAYKGSFNVRMSPDLHKEAVEVAKKQGITLNQFITNATRTAVANA